MHVYLLRRSVRQAPHMSVRSHVLMRFLCPSTPAAAVASAAAGHQECAHAAADRGAAQAE